MSQLLKTAKQSLFHHKDQSYYQLMSDLKADDWTAYPRPQLRRNSYLSLNGEWTIRNQHSKGKELPDQTIRVPFPPQAALSGYETDDVAKIPEELFYERRFSLPEDFRKHNNDRILLHFGAVDQIAHVFVNSRPVGTHEGGYLPFTFDITDFLRNGDGSGRSDRPESADGPGSVDESVQNPVEKCENLLQVLVEDHLDHFYPWGKQKKDRGGMWYTPVSGIWQSVWLEAVPETYISDLKIQAPADGNITMQPRINSQDTFPNHPFNIRIGMPVIADMSGLLSSAGAFSDGTSSSGPSSSVISSSNAFSSEVFSSEEFSSEINLYSQEALAEFSAAADDSGLISFNLKEMLPSDFSGELPLWTPDTPWLYPIAITYEDDYIESYFGLRTIELKKTDDYTRVCLNGQPVFLNGLLDQGYFSDGLYLPANCSGYARDIQSMKDLGFNILRKHIKVEPERYYFYCDCMGMMVMQDMVNNGSYSFLLQTALPTIGLKKQPEAGRTSLSKRENERRSFFLEHSRGIQQLMYNHPCVVAYTVFNEGWGQFNSREIGDRLRDNDPTRLYDYTSGWFEHGGSDFESIHEYFHPGQLKSTKPEKALFLSEFGGCTWQIPDHCYSLADSYGYGTCSSSEELTDHIISVYETMVLPSIKTGLCGCIYTQLSDVEDEANGLITYDRAILKPDRSRLLDVFQKLKIE